jgi:hypothetical protein
MHIGIKEIKKKKRKLLCTCLGNLLNVPSPAPSRPTAKEELETCTLA